MNYTEIIKKERENIAKRLILHKNQLNIFYPHLGTMCAQYKNKFAKKKKKQISYCVDNTILYLSP